MILLEREWSAPAGGVHCRRFKNFGEGTYYNFSAGKGVLASGGGLSPVASLPEGVAAVKLFETDGAPAVLASDKRLYTLKNGSYAPLTSSGFSKTVAACKVPNGVGNTLLYSNGICIYKDGNTGLIATAYIGFTAACFAYGRLWCYMNGRIRYGSPDDICNFTDSRLGGGYIDVLDGKGDIQALVPFENAILLVREHAVQRLDARGEQSDFRIEDVFETGERIVAESAAVGRGAFLFCTDAGAYSLRGNTCTRVYEREFTRYEIEAKQGGFQGGRYALFSNCTLDGERQTALFLFGESETEIVRADVEGVCGGYAIVGGRVCAIGGGTPLAAKWQSGVLNLGYGARKICLERIKIAGKGALWLRVVGEYGSRLLPVRCSGGGAELALRLKGENFRFELTTDGYAKIEEVTFLYRGIGV